MKCKYCGAEMSWDIKDPGWWKCDKCHTHWKLLRLYDDGKALFQPYKVFEGKTWKEILNK